MAIQLNHVFSYKKGQPFRFIPKQKQPIKWMEQKQNKKVNGYKYINEKIPYKSNVMKIREEFG